jgi:hypothetical protein
LAVGSRDLKCTEESLEVTIHNIGNEPSQPTQVALQVRGAHTWQTAGLAPVPAIESPTDFHPATTTVRLPMPIAQSYRVVVNPEHTQYELCLENNVTPEVQRQFPSTAAHVLCP